MIRPNLRGQPIALTWNSLHHTLSYLGERNTMSALSRVGRAVKAVQRERHSVSVGFSCFPRLRSYSGPPAESRRPLLFFAIGGNNCRARGVLLPAMATCLSVPTPAVVPGAAVRSTGASAIASTCCGRVHQPNRFLVLESVPYSIQDPSAIRFNTIWNFDQNDCATKGKHGERRNYNRRRS